MMNQWTKLCPHPGCCANYCNEWAVRHNARVVRAAEEESRRTHAEIVGDGWDADGRPVEAA